MPASTRPAQGLGSMPLLSQVPKAILDKPESFTHLWAQHLLCLAALSQVQLQEVPPYIYFYSIYLMN